MRCGWPWNGNPQLSARRTGVRAANGRLLQAGARLNPTLSAGVEDFGGSGEKRGFEAGQTTIALEQTLDIRAASGLRAGGTASAEMKLLAEWDRDAPLGCDRGDDAALC